MGPERLIKGVDCGALPKTRHRLARNVQRVEARGRLQSDFQVQAPETCHLSQATYCPQRQGLEPQIPRK